MHIHGNQDSIRTLERKLSIWDKQFEGLFILFEGLLYSLWLTFLALKFVNLCRRQGVLMGYDLVRMNAVIMQVRFVVMPQGTSEGNLSLSLSLFCFSIVKIGLQQFSWTTDTWDIR
jgi:hypothetical protein